jgi:TrmH family RNA methyltransferase
VPGFDITSASNPRLKWLVGLRERKHRDEEGVFVVESPLLLGQATSAGLSPTEVFVDGSVPYDGPGSPVTVAPEMLARASYRRRSQGIIAVFPQFPTDLGAISVTQPALVIVTEAIEKPGNLGAMLRTADAAGADALIVTGEGVDPFNPNVVRASLGALFSVPLALASLEALPPWMDQHRIQLIAASPQAETSLWDVDLTGPVGIVVGSEDRGLTPQALSMATESASIPMKGRADSLNASVSLALFAYEVVRQRR